MMGQRAMLHTVCATSPTPNAEPIAEAKGPDTASMNAAPRRHDEAAQRDHQLQRA
jgi:hypothetical protein